MPLEKNKADALWKVKKESGARGLREEQSDHGDVDLKKWHSMYHLLGEEDNRTIWSQESYC